MQDRYGFISGGGKKRGLIQLSHQYFDSSSLADLSPRSAPRLIQSEIMASDDWWRRSAGGNSSITVWERRETEFIKCFNLLDFNSKLSDWERVFLAHKSTFSCLLNRQRSGEPMSRHVHWTKTKSSFCLLQLLLTTLFAFASYLLSLLGVVGLVVLWFRLAEMCKNLK